MRPQRLARPIRMHQYICTNRYHWRFSNQSIESTCQSLPNVDTIDRRILPLDRSGYKSIVPKSHRFVGTCTPAAYLRALTNDNRCITVSQPSLEKSSPPQNRVLLWCLASGLAIEACASSSSPDPPVLPPLCTGPLLPPLLLLPAPCFFIMASFSASNAFLRA